MTVKRRCVETTIRGWMIVILFLFLSIKSCAVKGQTMTLPTQEPGYTEDRFLLGDSVGSNKRKSDKLFYLGYEIALSRPIYTLKSDLTELNGRRVNNLGVIVGGVVANKFGKLKGNAGLYYSDATLPCSFDLFTTGVSANVYLLRIGNASCHTVEPYFIGGISQQHVKFYGNYLDQKGTPNYSTSDEQFLGKEVATQFNLGLGAEYQLENDHGDFIHLFTEVAYGVPIATRCTFEIFDRTHIIHPMNISVGVSFGKMKQRSK